MLLMTLCSPLFLFAEVGDTFTAQTAEGIDMVFTILDEDAKTCQVGYLDGAWDKTAVDRNAVEDQEVTIPSIANGYTVIKIGKEAFHGLRNYTLTMPSSVTMIDNYAFFGDINLTLQVERTIPLVIDENVFVYLSNSSLRVPIGSKAAYAAATGWSQFENFFEGNEGSTFTAETIEGYEMVFTILDESAKTCQVGYIDGSSDKMAVDKHIVSGSLTIPETTNGYKVVKIGRCALWNIYKMTSVTIPNTVTAIDEFAFTACYALTSFNLPASVTTIGERALSELRELTSITVAEGNPLYDSREHCNALIETATNKLLLGCKNTIIPSSVFEIEELAFYELSNYSLTIPSTITKIDDHAFSVCKNLILKVEHTTPLEINDNVFELLSNSTLRVPAGCKAAYVAATGWNKFDNIFEGNEGSTFTAQTAEGIDVVFTILDDTEKTCQVSYLDGGWNKQAVDKDAVDGAVTIPETVEGYTVVKIGKYAFTGVYNMRTVTIPNTVKTIEEYAFSYCTGLTSFELPASVTSLGKQALSRFDNTTSIKVADGNPKYDSRDNCNAIIETTTNKLLFGYKTTTIPATVEEIGEYAFYYLGNCSLTIPSTITKIDDYAFSTCSKLTLEVEHTAPLVISENVFEYLNNSTLRVPVGSKAAYASAIGWKNFGTIQEGNEGTTFTAQTAEGLDVVFTILDESAKTCQVGYLDGSSNKNAVDRYAVVGLLTIPEKANGYKVVKIGKYAFRNAYKMTSVTIPNTVTAIDEYAFYLCNALTSFELPASVTSLGAYALSGFSKATSIKVTEGNPIYDSRDNCNAIIETATNKLLFGYKTTTIPATVEEIGGYAFYNLSNFTLTIPSSVTKIDNYAFRNCNNLILEVEHKTPLEISEKVFQGLSTSTLRVPAGSKAAYAAATGWKNFGTIMEGNEGSIITAKTTESYDMVFTILNDTEKTCQVGYIYGSYDMIAVDKNAINGPVTIPEIVNGYTVVKIGKYALYNVNRMTSVTIPNTVTSIDDYAFAYCYGLTSFEIPASVTSIGNNAIYRFDSATSIKVAEGNPNYDSRDNCNAIIETATNKLLFGFKVTTIPANVTEIGEYAFGAYSTYTLTIPSTITKICDNAFFANFYLTLQVEHTTPLVINDNVFKSLTNCTLRVPVGTKSLYLAADGWKNFGEENIIEMSGEKKGDVTGDGIVSVSDVVMIISYVLGENPSDFNAAAADVNGDGKVTVADVVMVIDSILKAN